MPDITSMSDYYGLGMLHIHRAQIYCRFRYYNVVDVDKERLYYATPHRSQDNDKITVYRIKGQKLLAHQSISLKRLT